MNRTHRQRQTNISFALNDEDEDKLYGLAMQRKIDTSTTKSRNNTTGFTKSQGVSKRGWSPHQAVLCRRKKLESDHDTLNDSLGQLRLTDDDEDYLTKSLSSINDSLSVGDRPKYAGRRPLKPSKDVKAEQCYTTIVPESWKRQPLNPKLKSSSISGTKKHSTSVATNGSKLSSRKAHLYKGNMNDKDGLEIPIEMQQKLCVITDPNTPIREKVQMELELMKGSPERKQLYLRYKSQFDRAQFLEWRASEERKKSEKIKSDFMREENIEKEFLKSLQRKRDNERSLELERRDRERKVLDAARRHQTETILETMAEIKKAAEAATISAELNKIEKQAEEETKRKRIERFRRNEGSAMTSAERTLKEALMKQENPVVKRNRKDQKRKINAEKRKRRSHNLPKRSTEERRSTVLF